MDPLVFVTSSSCHQGHNDVVRAVWGASFTCFDWRDHPRASPWEDPQLLGDRAVLERDRENLILCAALVLVLPSGRGGHIEAGFVAGRGKPVITVGIDKPELMYGLFNHHVRNAEELLAILKQLRKGME